MEGANISLLNFNVDKSAFEIDQNSMKGGKDEMGLFEQLLEQYNVTAEDVTFEHENLTDEELKAKFEEMFGNAEADPTPESNFEDENPESEDEGAEGDESEESEIEDSNESESDPEEESQNGTQDDEPIKKIENSITYNINGKEFAVSLNDKIYALATLVNDAYSETDNAYYNVLVYDKELVMVDMWAGSAYRQSYSERAGVFSLKGDRVPVHAIYVTDTEEAEIDSMRSKYSAMSEELAKYQKAEEESRKEVIINSEDWEAISDSAEFAKIREHISEYSAEEIQNKCDALLLSFAKSNSRKAHVAKDTNQHKFSLFRVPEGKSAENKRYGNLFD